jgi:hypothetical protein
VRWERDRTADGLNLLAPREGTTAALIDLGGRVVHRWSQPSGVRGAWQHVELLADGDLLVVQKHQALLRIGWDSALRWRLEGRFHHDVDPASGWSVVARPASRRLRGRPVPYLEDVLVRVDLEAGRVAEELPLTLPLVRDVRPRLLAAAPSLTRPGQDPYREDGPGDLLHVNSVRAIPAPVPGLGEAGDLLISPRVLDAVYVVDPRRGTIRWRWDAAGLDGQHHATLVPPGHVLVFDNGRKRRWSRVLEIEPRSGAVVWSHRAEPPETLWSESRGAAQRLANGHTLVTESDFGRAFEVTPGGEIVWEFFGPLLAEDPARRATLYRVTRIEPPLLDSIRTRLPRPR